VQHRDVGQYDLARDLFQRAIDVRKALLHPFNVDLISSVNAMAMRRMLRVCVCVCMCVCVCVCVCVCASSRFPFCRQNESVLLRRCWLC
jgi:hypothetical protein